MKENERNENHCLNDTEISNIAKYHLSSMNNTLRVFLVYIYLLGLHLFAWTDICLLFALQGMATKVCTLTLLHSSITTLQQEQVSLKTIYSSTLLQAGTAVLNKSRSLLSSNLTK
jgi:hypothetical protein